MSTPLSKPAWEITQQVTLPDNAGYTWLYDSTDPRSGLVALGKTAGVRTVGPQRGTAKNLRANIGLASTGQNITLKLYTLDGAGAWQLFTPSGGEVTVTAGGVPAFYEWNVPASDILIGVLAGATAPTTITTTLYFTER